MDKIEFLTKSSLKERGWTESAITKWLTVDHTAQNPVYKSSSPVKLYLLSEVERVESTDEFKTWLNKREDKKSSYKKATSTKRQHTKELCLDIIKSIVPPRRLDFDVLYRKAIQSYNSFHCYCPHDEGYVYSDCRDFPFINRIVVNYIRHSLMESYDEDSFASKGKVGTRDYYKAYKKAIMRVIFIVYPELEYDWESYAESCSEPRSESFISDEEINDSIKIIFSKLGG